MLKVVAMVEALAVVELPVMDVAGVILLRLISSPSPSPLFPTESKHILNLSNYCHVLATTVKTHSTQEIQLVNKITECTGAQGFDNSTN